MLSEGVSGGNGFELRLLGFGWLVPPFFALVRFRGVGWWGVSGEGTFCLPFSPSVWGSVRYLNTNKVAAVHFGRLS